MRSISMHILFILTPSSLFYLRTLTKALVARRYILFLRCLFLRILILFLSPYSLMYTHIYICVCVCVCVYQNRYTFDVGEGIKFLQLLDEHIDAIAEKQGVKTIMQRSVSLKTAPSTQSPTGIARGQGHRATVGSAPLSSTSAKPQAQAQQQQPPLPPRNVPITSSGLRSPMVMAPVVSPSSSRRLLARSPQRSSSARAAGGIGSSSSSSSSSSRGGNVAAPPPLPLPPLPPPPRTHSAPPAVVSVDEDVGVCYTDVELNVPAAQSSKSAATIPLSSPASRLSRAAPPSPSNLGGRLEYAMVDINRTEALASENF